MLYDEAIEILFTKLPMFQRSGPAAYKYNLDGTKAVCDLVGNPENKLRFVHIAGTNGKGTVSHMVASVMQKAGYKTGLFTSPHLIDFRERIRVNGEKIPEAYVVDFVERFSSKWGTPSFFELTFGMALQYFVDEKTEIVILETGMGGRLDSTNNIPTAEVCSITNIGLDHMQFLGEDIRSIAREKAGIFKNHVPVVLGKMRPEAQSVILEHALKMSCEMYYGRVVPDFLIEFITTPFASENLATSSKIIDVLRIQGWNISTESECEGLAKYKELTNQDGRWQFIPPSENGSSILLDCAHNVDGMNLLIASMLREFPEIILHIVFGTVGDKDPSSVLSLIPNNAVMYWCESDVPRSLDVETLKKIGLDNGLSGNSYASVGEAVSEARKFCFSDDKSKAIVCGSIYVVGDALKDIEFSNSLEA
jgi:dihydrofolate synthase/folylpolyglutamate synthase